MFMQTLSFFVITILPIVAACIIASSAFGLWWVYMSCNAHVHIRGSVLVVFAHPDDESMFFSPLLYYLRVHNIRTHLLCLSNGNFYGQGLLREHELIKSARIFGIKQEYVHVVNNKELQDGGRNSWSRNRVKQEIDKSLNKIGNISTIFTFDQNGVSQHANHISAYNGVVAVRESMPYGITFLKLRTRSLFSKYIGVCSLFYRLIFFNAKVERSNFVIIATPGAVLSC